MQHQSEIQAGQRYEFGANWARFIVHLTPARIAAAKQSLREDLGDLSGKDFLDVGSGSGLFSLAAHQLGATVTSFDYDPKSVATTLYLQRQHGNAAPPWRIQEGSVLDEKFMAQIPMADIVYSWGVLHHTGHMWTAIDRAQQKLKPGGKLLIALYNDQGALSRFWLHVKKIYCSGILGRAVMSCVFVPIFAVGGLIKDLLRFKNPLRRYQVARDERGMSPWHDWHDWLGGLPFEVAKPALVQQKLAAMRLQLVKEKRVGNRSGCNIFIFTKQSAEEKTA